MEVDALVQLIQYGGISALSIYLMFKITSNAIEKLNSSIENLRKEISALRSDLRVLYNIKEKEK